MRCTVRMAWFRKDGTDRGAAASDTDVHPLQQVTDLERALADRQALVQMCLYALDRARSGGVVERLEEGLAAIGVQALWLVGLRFVLVWFVVGGVFLFVVLV